MQYFKYRSQNGGLLSVPDKYPEQLGDFWAERDANDLSKKYFDKTWK